jgi:predicted transposase YdaD
MAGGRFSALFGASSPGKDSFARIPLRLERLMMTSEQRRDRLERIAMLMVRAGARVRREQNEKINIIIDAQIRNEDRFATLAEDLARSHKELSGLIAQSHKELSGSIAQSHSELSGSIAQSYNELSESIAQSQNELSGSIGQSQNELSQSLTELAKAQTRTENRLDSLIEIITSDRNGNSG